MSTINCSVSDQVISTQEVSTQEVSIAKVGNPTPLKKTIIKCPDCGTLIDTSKCIYTDQYIRCLCVYQCEWSSIDTSKCFYTGQYIRCPYKMCDLRFIPRDEKIRSKVTKILDLISDEYFSGLNNTTDTTCLACYSKYNRVCVPHNDKLSVCPDCSFFNPHVLIQQALDCIYPSNSWKICEDCEEYYIDHNITVTSYLYDWEDEIVTSWSSGFGGPSHCAYCQDDSYDVSAPFPIPTFPLPDKFISKEFVGNELELHLITQKYLPPVDPSMCTNSRVFIRPSRELDESSWRDNVAGYDVLREVR